MPLMSIIPLLIAICAAAAAGQTQPRTTRSRFAVTGSVLALVATCLIVQLCVPAVLPALRRDAGAIEAGEVYRLFTALWFQDGGLGGGLFNLGLLAIIGFHAERLMRRPAWIGIYLLGGLLSELVALAWKPIGAGNSVAAMSLAGAILVSGFLRAAPPPSRVAGAIGLVAGAVLAAQHDIHGAAVLIGGSLALALFGLAKRRGV